MQEKWKKHLETNWECLVDESTGLEALTISLPEIPGHVSVGRMGSPGFRILCQLRL
jgi:hypothetical protein